MPTNVWPTFRKFKVICEIVFKKSIIRFRPKIVATLLQVKDYLLDLQLVAFLFVLASFLVSSFLLLRGVSFSLQPPWPSFRPLPCEVFPPLPIIT